MMHRIFYFILLTVHVLAWAQTSQVMPISVERMPDYPLGYVNLLYQNSGYEYSSLSTANQKALNKSIETGFNTLCKPYLVVFSNSYTETMVQEQTEKLLKKWDFQNNYPYNYLVVLSNYPPIIVFGKYVTHKDNISNTTQLIIQSLWKSASTEYKKLSDIIEYIKTLNITVANTVYQDYIFQWDKLHFFNYQKIVSEKQEKYLNKLLEDTYHHQNIRFWIIAGTLKQNKKILAELLQKADFNTQSRQAIIVISIDVFTVNTVFTKDLQNQWNTFVESQIKKCAEFYHDNGWYYDAIKETFIMTKEQLLYNSIAEKQKEEQLKQEYTLKQQAMYHNIVKTHKILFWIIAILLLVPLIWGKKYVEKVYQIKDNIKRNDANSKLLLGLAYITLLITTSIWIVSSTPLFYIHTILWVRGLFLKPFVWMLLYFIILFFLLRSNTFHNPSSIKILLVCAIVIYFFMIDIGYTFFVNQELISQNAQVGTDFINIVFIFIIAIFAFSHYRNLNQTHQSINHSSGSSTRAGFGKKSYVSKYMSK